MMSSCIQISGGRVVDPANGRDEVGELCAVDGVVSESLNEQQKESASKLDATGLVVAPGLVDIHVHFREPGQTHKETIATGSRAAAAGGFTTVVCMPKTTPPADNVSTVQHIKDIIERDALVKVYPTGTITLGQEGQHLAPIGSLQSAGVVAITDDGFCVQNNEIMRRAVEYANMFDLVVMDHCQDMAMTEGAVINEGHWSLRLGLRGWPSAAEEIVVSRNVILSNLTGGRVHLQHITSGNAVDIIRRAKSRGVPVSAEVTPHHLHLTDQCLRSYNTNFKMNPPLRSEADRQMLIEGLLDGTIDCIGTDHAPHSDYEKDQEFDHAPNGVTGLETALAVCLEVLYQNGRCTLNEVISWLTCKAAETLRLKAGRLSPGDPADITVFDPDEPWVVEADQFQSRSANSPWIGETLKGKVKCTLVDGRVVWGCLPSLNG